MDDAGASRLLADPNPLRLKRTCITIHVWIHLKHIVLVHVTPLEVFEYIADDRFYSRIREIDAAHHTPYTVLGAKSKLLPRELAYQTYYRKLYLRQV